MCKIKKNIHTVLFLQIFSLPLDNLTHTISSTQLTQRQQVELTYKPVKYQWANFFDKETQRFQLCSSSGESGFYVCFFISMIFFRRVDQ